VAHPSILLGMHRSNRPPGWSSTSTRRLRGDEHARIRANLPRLSPAIEFLYPTGRYQRATSVAASPTSAFRLKL
jgi:hypothetical protein